jgi:ABC-2 type transport system ATP-binding protein
MEPGAGQPEAVGGRRTQIWETARVGRQDPVAAASPEDGGVVVAGVRKSFGDVVALDDVSFTAPAGAVTGLVGRNGAGKTTLLRIVVGVARADRGRVLLAGSTPARTRPGTVGASLGAAAHPGRRGRAHLRAVAAAIGAPDSDVVDRLAEVGLDGAADRVVRRWSLGMRQRLALATALLGHPSFLVLDEPTNGLDPDGVAWLRVRLRAFADAGGTVLVSSHLLLELAQIADHLVLLDHRVLWQGPASEAQRHGGIEALYQTVTHHAAVEPVRRWRDDRHEATGVVGRWAGRRWEAVR